MNSRSGGAPNQRDGEQRLADFTRRSGGAPDRCGAIQLRKGANQTLYWGTRTQSGGAPDQSGAPADRKVLQLPKQGGNDS
jgi:hypothetical protein